MGSVTLSLNPRPPTPFPSSMIYPVCLLNTKIKRASYRGEGEGYVTTSQSISYL